MAGSVESACVVQVNNMNYIQRMIDINASNLDGLRTQCTTSSDLIQQEIRDQEVCRLIYVTLVTRLCISNIEHFAHRVPIAICGYFYCN